ncbi:hypothetical protein [Acinetobacter sp. Marseille-Q1618]|uniref:hypothetical protein n=1 Tax=Acinetobacter sp. Marseille-Q1618 TaxID=2697502 RepID=UPI0015715F36|nr:hypothetical protein [Acinetobacter sp. Marseille-Q1618]
MAGEQTRAFIANERSAGTSDIKIFNKLLDNPKFVAGLKKANQETGVTNRQFAAGLGLKISNQPVDLPKMQQDSKKAQAKEQGKTKAWESGLLGFSDLGAGVLQGVNYAADGVSKGINKVAGTNLDTKSYERVTQQRKEIEENHNLRREANDQGFDWMRLGGQVAATAPMAALGRTYQGAKILSGAGAKVAAQNAAVGAGIGAASFAKDADHRMLNTALGGVGGAAGGAIGEKIGRGVSSLNRKFNPASSTHVTNAQVESQIDIILSQMDDGLNGIRLGDLTAQAQAQLKNEVKKLMQQGRTPDAQTLQRMSVFTDLKSKGFDLKPTGKQATGSAQLWTKETNLSKLDGAEPLAKKYSQDHANLKALVDDFEFKTGGNAADEFQVGDDLFKQLRQQDESRNNYIAAMYNHAKQHTGNDLTLDAGRFANNMKNALDEDLADISLLPSPLLKKVQDFANGVKPFTLAEKEVMVKQLNRRISGADNQTRYALQSFRNSLEKEVDDSLNAFGTQLQGQAKTAWDDARKAATGRFGLIDRTPALKKALNDAEPDKAFDQLVWRGNVRQLESMVKELENTPEVLNNIKQMIVKRIAEKSFGVLDTFSPKGMSDALKSIGDRKLALFFKPEELKHLKNINAAGRYLISQPPGANVNHSNSASAFANYLSSFIKLPVVKGAVDKWVVSPSRGVNAHIKINQGANALAKTSTQNPSSGAELSLIDRLVKAGILSGANLPNQ